MDGQFAPYQPLQFEAWHPPGYGLASGTATATYVTATGSTANATAYTFTNHAIGTAAADRIVVVAFWGNGTTTTSGATVTIGGNNATVPAGSNINTTDLEAGFAYLAVAAGTTATIVVTFSGAKSRAGISVWSVTGSSGTPTDTDETTATGTSAALSALTVPSNGCGVFLAAHQNTTTTGWGWTNANERDDQTVENSSRWSGADTSSAGTNTITAAVNTSVTMALVGIAFGP